ncbi:MAG: hypothetical protein ACO1SV_17885 [Fimbriimonas sp.]
MTSSQWMALLCPAIMVNGFALGVGSVAYMTFTIQLQNQMHYWITRDKAYLRQANDAEKSARAVVKWLRPSLLILLNSGLVYLYLTKPPGR